PCRLVVAAGGGGGDGGREQELVAQGVILLPVERVGQLLIDLEAVFARVHDRLSAVGDRRLQCTFSRIPEPPARSETGNCEPGASATGEVDSRWPTVDCRYMAYVSWTP